MSVRNDGGTVLETVNTLIGCKGSREFAQVLGRHLSSYFQCDVTGLLLYNSSAETFTALSEMYADPTRPAYEIGQLPAAGTMKEGAVKAGKALVCDDLVASDWTEGRVLSQTNAAVSCVAAPVRLHSAEGEAQNDRCIAVMFVAADRTAAFTEQDRLLMESIAEKIAPALQAVLHAEERDLLMTINQRVLVGTVTLESLIPMIRETVQEVIPHDMIGLIRFTAGPEGPWLDPVHIEGVELDFAPLRQHPFMQLAPAELLATGRPLLVTGHGSGRFPEIPYIESLGILSSMLCPLKVENECYGFLALGSRRRNAFSERDLILAEQIVHQLSQAVANILAYEEIRRLKEKLEKENVYLRDEIRTEQHFEEIVGESAALKRVLHQLEIVALTDSTVLILGETGTGKELIARALHHLSGRRDRAFVKLNCAAIPTGLLESELFGHEKGAFTGAIALKVGRFELAHRGTIFLDEIGEVPPELQSKLLRVLQEHEFERLGGTRTIRVDVRLVAATNRDLAAMVEAKEFRSDLYYRLNVFPVTVPPLRERTEDIPMLVRYFAQRHATRMNRRIESVPAKTLDVLSRYHWPGNVRELENLVERAVILSDGPELLVPLAELKPAGGPAGPSAMTLEAAEREHILRTLRDTKWMVSGAKGAATRLGMKRTTLLSKMKKLGIARPS